MLSSYDDGRQSAPLLGKDGIGMVPYDTRVIEGSSAWVTGPTESEYMMIDVKKFPPMPSTELTMLSTITAAHELYSESDVSNLNTSLCAMSSGMMARLERAPICQGLADYDSPRHVIR